MADLLRESKSRIRRLLENRTNIREEMTSLGRIVDTITMIFAIIFLIPLLVIVFSFGVFGSGFAFMIFVIIVIFPLGIIDNRIRKKAKNEI